MKSKEDIYNQITELIHELFEIPKDEITLTSRFYEDLDLDSIDAIDLIGQFQVIVGERINPEHFKSVLTVGDVVNAAVEILNRKQNEDSN